MKVAEITTDQVRNIADLVRIAISEEDAVSYAEHLTNVISYADKLSELNTDDVEPTTHGIVGKNVMREDIPNQSLTQEEALKNAPDKQNGHFKVPSIME